VQYALGVNCFSDGLTYDVLGFPNREFWTLGDASMQKPRLALVAVGGNSLIQDERHKSLRDQYAVARESMRHIAEMIAQGWNVVIVHGNGPQVGFLLRSSELARPEVDPIPLDFCGADTQGAIGYMFQQELYNEFRERGIHRQPVTLITQTVVRQDDPAFQSPTKPVGSFLSEALARERAQSEGWRVVDDAGRGWRRVVPSPTPLRIIEVPAIQRLLAEGMVVIAAGGGGIPVVEDSRGLLSGVEAVIDKDYAAALMALELKVDLLLITTAVEKVAINFGADHQKWLRLLSRASAQEYLDAGQFPEGSMGPKIRAILYFLKNGGRHALITNPPNICRALQGKTGTWFHCGMKEVEGRSGF
jgi:carbamate kinase